MSASDAAPLPRLGEVFFDVRGQSRTMRLSWYADTGIAVFSIWQGGVCTGTFRLPIADLSRMIDILQRGPQGGYDGGDAGGHGGAEHGQRGHADEYPGEFGADYGGDPGYGPDYAQRQFGADDRSPDYRGDDYGRGDFGSGAYGPGDYDSAEYGSGDYRAGDYGAGERAPDLGYGPPQYRTGEHDGADYGAAGFGRARQERVPRPQAWPDVDDRYQPDVTGEHSSAPDEAGYGQQRFVPPYVRGQRDSSATGYSADADYRLPADPGPGARHSGGRHSSGQEQ